MDNQVSQSTGTRTGQAGSFCANCGSPLATGQAFCPSCGTPAPAQTAQSGVCSSCGTPITPGQAFCASCGAPAPAPASAPTAQPNVCSNCGSAISPEAEFCAVCGQRKAPAAGAVNPATAPFGAPVAPKKKSTKKLIIIIVAAVLAVVALIVGVSVHMSVQEQKRQEAIAQARRTYIQNAKEFASLSLDAGANLEEISDTVQEYWYDSIWNDYYGGDINVAIARALQAKSTELSLAETYDTRMTSLYGRLRDIPAGLEDDYQIRELNRAVKDLYNVYTDFYDFATDPSGSYNSFSENNGEKTDDYVSAYKALNNLVTDK